MLLLFLLSWVKSNIKLTLNNLFDKFIIDLPKIDINYKIFFNSNWHTNIYICYTLE